MQVLRQALKDLRRHSPWEMVQTAVAVIEDEAFDWRYGVDTRGITPLAELAIDSRHVAHGVHYAPTRVRYFRAVLRALPIPRDSVFVDLGAGKGRMLLLAAQSGCFRKVVGVEFSGELCRTAERNIRRFQRHYAGNVTVEVVHADAADYEVQPDQNVFFMFNPFGPVVMQQVIQCIGAIPGGTAAPHLGDLSWPQDRLPEHPCRRRIQGDRSRHLRQCEDLNLHQRCRTGRTSQLRPGTRRSGRRHSQLGLSFGIAQ